LQAADSHVGLVSQLVDTALEVMEFMSQDNYNLHYDNVQI